MERHVGADEGAAAFAKAWNDGTREIDGPVAGHQQLQGLHPSIVRRQRSALMHKLVSQVVDGMAKNLQRTARRRGDAAAAS